MDDGGRRNILGELVSDIIGVRVTIKYFTTLKASSGRYRLLCEGARTLILGGIKS